MNVAATRTAATQKAPALPDATVIAAASASQAPIASLGRRRSASAKRHSEASAAAAARVRVTGACNPASLSR